MQINISGHHVGTDRITEQLRAQQIQQTGTSFRQTSPMPRLHSALKKTRQKAEGDVHVAGGQLFATHEHDDMYAAI